MTIINKILQTQIILISRSCFDKIIILLKMEGSPRSSRNKNQQYTTNTLAKQEENEMAIFQEAIVFNEKPFRIQGDKLKELIHRSVGGLTFLNRYKQIKAGSGVLISKDTVLTAAHNVFDPICNAENSGFKFYLGANGVGEEYHVFDGWKYPDEFKTCSPSAKLPFDYAIMKLKRPIEFQQFLPLSLACQQCLLKDNEEIMLKVFGFPCAYPDSRSFEGKFEALDEFGKKIKLYQYGLARKGRIVVADSSNFKIGYGISTLPGQSGCPVIAQDSIIAVHVGGDKAKFNVGRMIDANFIAKIQKWGEELGSSKFKIQQENVCHHMKQLLLDKKQIFNKPSSTNPVKTNPQTKLQLPEQGLKSADLSEYANLLQLNLSYNSLEAIDLSHCPLLQKINLQKNQLRSVDTKANINLTQLYLSSNKLSAIDVSKNINLTWLWLSSNQLSAINLSANSHLQCLHLDKNKIAEIDLSRNTKLEWLQIQENRLSRISLAVAGNVPADNYTGSFVLSHQQSAACRVELRCEEENRGKAAGIAGKWREKYSQQRNNKHACTYNYQVL